MNKSVEYKNIDEFVKMSFPDVYHGKLFSADVSLEAFMKRNSENFKLKINNIINNSGKKQTAHNKR